MQLQPALRLYIYMHATQRPESPARIFPYLINFYQSLKQKAT